jgi:hypothetical protein
MASSAASDIERARMDELEQKYEEERRKRKEEQGASGGSLSLIMKYVTFKMDPLKHFESVRLFLKLQGGGHQ